MQHVIPAAQACKASLPQPVSRMYTVHLDDVGANGCYTALNNTDAAFARLASRRPAAQLE